MSDKKNREQLPLFDFIPEADPGLQSFNSLPHRIWTEHKARLVERYLYYFIFITRHGTYIDGFAGQQYPGQEHSWAAREVIESRPRWLRNFFLCDIDSSRAAELRAMVSSQPPPDRARKEQPRQIEVECADFNIWVDHVLGRGLIGEKEATFALLDQRTFECLWSTVAKLAKHKRDGPSVQERARRARAPRAARPSVSGAGLALFASAQMRGLHQPEPPRSPGVCVGTRSPPRSVRPETSDLLASIREFNVGTLLRLAPDTAQRSQNSRTLGPEIS